MPTWLAGGWEDLGRVDLRLGALPAEPSLRAREQGVDAFGGGRDHALHDRTLDGRLGHREPSSAASARRSRLAAHIASRAGASSPSTS